MQEIERFMLLKIVRQTSLRAIDLRLEGSKPLLLALEPSQGRMEKICTNKINPSVKFPP